MKNLSTINNYKQLNINTIARYLTKIVNNVKKRTITNYILLFISSKFGLQNF